MHFLKQSGEPGEPAARTTFCGVKLTPNHAATTVFTNVNCSHCLTYYESLSRRLGTQLRERISGYAATLTCNSLRERYPALYDRHYEARRAEFMAVVAGQSLTKKQRDAISAKAKQKANTALRVVYRAEYDIFYQRHHDHLLAGALQRMEVGQPIWPPPEPVCDFIHEGDGRQCYVIAHRAYAKYLGQLRDAFHVRVELADGTIADLPLTSVYVPDCEPERAIPRHCWRCGRWIRHLRNARPCITCDRVLAGLVLAEID